MSERCSRGHVIGDSPVCFVCHDLRVRGVAVAEPSENGAIPYGPRAITVRVSDVQRQEVTWLWQDRLPAGRLTGIIGDPGAGKSWLTLAMATAITKGAALPCDSPREAGDVLVLTAEDGLADTVRPRLEDMGADLERVTVLTAVRNSEGAEHHPSLVDDLPVLADLLAVGRYSLVIIDPINAYLGRRARAGRRALYRGREGG